MRLRILSITAGAAGMYCGSCLRDNALAAELLARGHDVTLLPLYTPTLTDEANVSHSRVLFGGISVYLQQKYPFFRKAPRLLDRLLDRPGVIRTFAERAVSVDPRFLGDMTVSMLEGTDGVLRREFDKLVEWVRGEPAPDVVNLPNSLLIGLARPIREALGCPVTCTLQGEDLFLAGLSEPYRSRALELIRRHVVDVDRFIAVSRFCADFMGGQLRIPPERMSIVPLGIDLRPYLGQAGRAGQASQAGQAGQAKGGGRENVFRIGYFARVAPEKGLQLLADAYVAFRTRVPEASVRLDAAGYLAPADRPYLDKVKQSLERAGFGSEFTYRGVVDLEGKVSFLRSLDVLSVPAIYDEPKGIFLLEAMAAGVPVVQPRRGGFVEIVDSTGGGLLVEPDNPERLAEGLEMMHRDPESRRQMGQRGADAVRSRYSVQCSADRLLDVYGSVVAARESITARTARGPRGSR